MRFFKYRYSKKTYFKTITNNKNRFRTLFKKKLKKNKNINNLYFKKKYHFYPIFFKNNYALANTVPYNTYQHSLISLKKKFNNIKYIKILELIRTTRIKLSKKNFSGFLKLKTTFILNFISVYNSFFYSIYIDVFFFFKFLKKKNRLIYFLILSFKKKRLYINLKNIKKKNYISLSTGLFIKFFEKRKSIKKNKAIKLLMAKYLRKLFIISKIKNLILIVKKTPVFINEIINFFNLPIAHKFLNPIDQKIIEESITKNLTIKFLYFIFMDNKDFSKNKRPQKGRIKRKILRKVTFENKIVD